MLGMINEVILLQDGLKMHQYTKTINGVEYLFRDLYSYDNYCFYDLEQPENYNYNEDTGERLELKQENELVYMRSMRLAIEMKDWTIEQLNAEFVSVPIKNKLKII